MTNEIEKCDVLVVGARCAGAATALLFARAGLKVLMIDRAPQIADTLSTHAIMRAGVAMLDTMGVLPAIISAGTPAVTRTCFVYGDDTVDIAVKPIGDVPGLYAPRRFVLDAALCDAALSAGVRLWLGTSFEEVVFDACGRVSGAELRLPDGSRKTVSVGLVVGADGRTSKVAEAVGARVERQDRNCASTVYGYFDGIANEGYRWFFSLGLQAGMIPTTGGKHCVFASCRPTEFELRIGSDPLDGIARTIARWQPEIANGLVATGPSERLRRFPGAPGQIRDCAGRGWALVGDAGYFKDPATAHGITDALLDAGRLVRSWVATPGRLRDYREQRDAHAAVLFDITHRIASFDWDFEELADLHRRLNDQMKAEFASMSGASASKVLAA